MAREILFKAKRIDKNEGEWVEGYVSRPHSRDTEKGILSYYFNALDENGWVYECIVSAETVCPYIGKTDKNGNKIYDKDIVGFLDISAYDNGYAEHYCIGQVIWDEDTLSFEVTERLSCESYEALDRDCEVIGSVLDTPELLETLS